MPDPCRCESAKRGAMETKVITPGKVVPYKCCLPNLNVSVKKDFDTDVLLTDVTHFQLLSLTFIEYGQNVNKHCISQIKLFWEKWAGFMQPMWSMLTKDNDSNTGMGL